jgi:hypothetical protein
MIGSPAVYGGNTNAKAATPFSGRIPLIERRRACTHVSTPPDLTVRKAATLLR